MAWFTQSAARAQTAIFISYRRDDTAGHAGRIADRLKARFGKHAVFMDVSGNITPGEPFGEVIGRAVSSCDALLAIIGRHWLTADADGKRRIDDPGDFVRVEIARALARDVCVIPVLVDRAPLPRMEDLPEDLRRLSARQAIELSETGWDFDVSQIVNALDGVVALRRRAAFPKWSKVLGAITVLVALGISAWTFRQENTAAVEPTASTIPTGSESPSTSGKKSPVAQPRPGPVEPSRPSRGVPTDTSPDRPGPARELIAVPDVRGLELEAARTRLRESGLTVGAISFYTLPGRTPSTVYHQDTAAGTRVRADSSVGLYVVRERRTGIQSSGLVSLSHTEVWDLDGTSSGRDGLDIRFDASRAGKPRLQALDGAQLSVFGRSPPSRVDCTRAALSASAIHVQIGTYLCARTSEGRYASLRIEDLSAELRLNFETWEPSASTPHTDAHVRGVRLGDRDSYDFASNTRGTLSGGDFYVSIATNGAVQFFANNRAQRGLLDLGDIGDRPLSSVRLPGGDFYKYGVPAVEGHTYASLAREGREGHFIIFRVTRVTATFVTLSYIYR